MAKDLMTAVEEKKDTGAPFKKVRIVPVRMNEAGEVVSQRK